VDLAQIRGALESRQPGHSLPQALYNDPAMFEFDLHAIYGRSWLMAGFTCEVPDQGSYTSIRIGPWPVLIVRGRDGQIRGFHNSAAIAAQSCARKGWAGPRASCAPVTAGLTISTDR
jgi:Rieske 2Fe-2S family protein